MNESWFDVLDRTAELDRERNGGWNLHGVEELGD